MNYTAIAARMKVSRENLWRLRRRWPGLDAWVAEQIASTNEHLVGPVIRKMGMLGLRGSQAHAETFLKHMRPQVPFEAGHHGNPAGGVTFNGPTIVNVAVPRPGDPPVAASGAKVIEAGR